jgi:catechol 2,3-dioxygenase
MAYGNKVRFEIAHLAHTELLTSDPDGTLWFFKDLLGLSETAREGQSVYLRAYEDPYQNSLKITEGKESSLGHVAWRTTSPEALERRAKALEATGRGTGWIDGDLGHGTAYGFKTPGGHQMEVFWEAERYQASDEDRSFIKTRASKRPLHGIPPRRLDHVNCLTSNVRANKQALADDLGFDVREIIDAGEEDLGAWLSVNNLSHEIAFQADASGTDGRFHHIAFWYGIPQHATDAAEMFRENGIIIEAGPDRHALTQALFLYVFEPGGHRVELFGDAGILQFEPDYKTRVWTMDNVDVTFAIGGATVPWETYFRCGTPHLAEHPIIDPGVANPPPEPPESAAVAEDDHSLVREST